MLPVSGIGRWLRMGKFLDPAPNGQQFASAAGNVA
jgi:hypothetical protein